MTIKIFLMTPTIIGYIGDPPDQFKFIVPFNMYESGPPINVHERIAEIIVPAGTTPYAVYQQVWQTVYDACVGQGLPPPSKDDVFGIIPTPFAVLLPDLPQFA